jgi:hypothetical protein
METNSGSVITVLGQDYVYSYIFRIIDRIAQNKCNYIFSSMNKNFVFY